MSPPFFRTLHHEFDEGFFYALKSNEITTVSSPPLQGGVSVMRRTGRVLFPEKLHLNTTVSSPPFQGRGRLRNCGDGEGIVQQMPPARICNPCRVSKETPVSTCTTPSMPPGRFLHRQKNLKIPVSFRQ